MRGERRLTPPLVSTALIIYDESKAVSQRPSRLLWITWLVGEMHAFFCKQRQAEIDKKIKQMLSNTLRLNFCYLKIIHILHPPHHPKIVTIIRLIIMKMEMKPKNRSHRYDINRPRYRHGHKHSKYKNCLSKMILICIKQHLSKLWSSIHEKIKQCWGWVEKKLCLLKKACTWIWWATSVFTFKRYSNR